MDDGMGGAGLGVCPNHESVYKKAWKTNNAFYGATKAAVLNFQRWKEYKNILLK